MNDGVFKPNALFDGLHLQRDAGFRISNGRIAEIVDATPQARQLAGCVSPGFVDLQVNGGGGVMVNTTPTPDGFLTIAAAHRKHGTTAILPTVITDHPDVLDRAVQAAIACIGQDGLLGLHIEGPHIAQARRGTHASEFIRPMDERTLDCVRALRAHDVPVMITVAPEAATTADISDLTNLGAIVSLGHTDATAGEIDAALSAGARCGTHLFNAMSQMQGRAPGAVGALLASDAHFGMICDGHHVDDRMIKLALNAAAGQNRAFAVSDAMATVGGPDHFVLYGQTITQADGRLVNSAGNLAGAHLTLHEAVKRLVDSVGVSLGTALRMATSTPAAVIAKPALGQLVGQRIENVIVLSEDLATTTPLMTIL